MLRLQPTPTVGEEARENPPPPSGHSNGENPSGYHNCFATVCTGNPGCMMHIGAGLARASSHVDVRHPVELLDAAYAHDAAGRA